MLSNTKILGLLLVGLAICSCAMYLLSGVADESLGGFESASYAQYQIDMSGASSFTNASIDEINDGGLVLRRTDVLKSRNSLFRHRSARFVSSASVPSVSSISGGSAGACMTIHTTSSAEFHSFGGGGSAVGNIGGTLRTSTHNQSSAMSAAPIYATSGNTYRMNRSTESATISMNGTTFVESPNTDAPAAIIASSSSFNNSMLLGLHNASIGYNSTMMNYGVINPKGVPGLDIADFAAWLEDLIGDSDSGWLYSDDEDREYFDLVRLKEIFDEMYTDESGQLISGAPFSWEDFLAWFYANGKDNSEGYGENNEWYRLPLPDGVGVLLLLALLNAFVIYMRSRERKYSVEENERNSVRKT